MNEIMVRALTPRELAEQLRDSGDAATRVMALHYLSREDDREALEEQAAGLQDDLGRAENAKEEAEADASAFEDLLRECLSEDLNESLRDRIQAALR